MRLLFGVLIVDDRFKLPSLQDIGHVEGRASIGSGAFTPSLDATLIVRSCASSGNLLMMIVLDDRKSCLGLISRAVLSRKVGGWSVERHNKRWSSSIQVSSGPRLSSGSSVGDNRELIVLSPRRG